MIRFVKQQIKFRIHNRFYRSLRAKYWWMVIAKDKLLSMHRRAKFVREFANTHNIEAYVPQIGMHTVFLARENILFLEEWILYHKSIGVEYFFLYDNSAVEALDQSYTSVGAVAHEMDKRGMPYGKIVTMTDEEIREELDRIQREIPNVHIYPWSPIDEYGKIYYGQAKCQNMAIQAHRDEVDWMLFMDIDEYLVLSNNLSNICRQLAENGNVGGVFVERRMDNRYRHLDKQVHMIGGGCPYTPKEFGRDNYKLLCYLPRTKHIEIHMFLPAAPQMVFDPSIMYYRHYKCNHNINSIDVLPITDIPVNNEFVRQFTWMHPRWHEIVNEHIGGDDHQDTNGNAIILHPINTTTSFYHKLRFVKYCLSLHLKFLRSRVQDIQPKSYQRGDHIGNPPVIALHTVFIMKENILFLREWLEYYRLLGVSEFYLYDNSAVEISNIEGWIDFRVIPGKINKHSVPYGDIVTLSDSELAEIVANIQREVPGVHIIPWSPTDSAGKVVYNQRRAAEEVRKDLRGKVDWILSCDMDEYLCIPIDLITWCRELEDNGHVASYVSQVNMATQWRFLDRGVLDNHFSLPPSWLIYWPGKKYIYRPDQIHKVNVHDIESTRHIHWARRCEAVLMHHNIKQHPNTKKFESFKWHPQMGLINQVRANVGEYGSAEWRMSVIDRQLYEEWQNQ